MQPEDIIKKEFSRSFLGYDMREVDVFLDEVIDRMEQMEGERKEMIAAMEYLLGKLENQGELPTIQAKYLKGTTMAEKRIAEKLKTVAKDKLRKEQPIKTKAKQEMRQTRPAQVHAESAERIEKPIEKQPPRKILQRHKKSMEPSAVAKEPVAIEMETMDSAPFTDTASASSGREDAV